MFPGHWLYRHPHFVTADVDGPSRGWPRSGVGSVVKLKYTNNPASPSVTFTRAVPGGPPPGRPRPRSGSTRETVAYPVGSTLGSDGAWQSAGVSITGSPRRRWPSTSPCPEASTGLGCLAAAGERAARAGQGLDRPASRVERVCNKQTRELVPHVGPAHLAPVLIQCSDSPTPRGRLC